MSDFNHSFDSLKHIKSLSSKPDDDIDLGVSAVSMVAPDHEGASVLKYFNYLKKIQKQVADRHQALIDEGGDDDAGTQLAALKYVLSDTYDFRKTEPSFEILESADIMRVIDLGKGGASALCLLYMDVARKQSWHVDGLNFPSHFLCRIQKGKQHLIFDPTQQCKVLEAHDLRAILKHSLGPDAELSNHYFEGLSGLQTIIHLCNRLKSRRIEMSDYKGALAIVERMRLVVPDEYRLLLDAGVLYARTNQKDEAIAALESYIVRTPNQIDRQEAYLLLQELSDSQI